MKRTKKNVLMVAKPLSAKEKKEIMMHLTEGLKPVRPEEVSLVEMERLLRFYHPLDKAMIIYAMLLYVTTGKKVKMKNVVAQRHYNQMMEYVDDDMCTLPSHKHLMRLYEKYGLILPMNGITDGNL